MNIWGQIAIHCIYVSARYFWDVRNWLADAGSWPLSIKITLIIGAAVMARGMKKRIERIDCV